MTQNTPEPDVNLIDKLAMSTVYGKHPKLHRPITSMAGLIFTPYEAAILIRNVNLRTHPATSDTLENLPYTDTDSLAVSAYPSELYRQPSYPKCSTCDGGGCRDCA